MITQTQATQAIAAHSNNNTINPSNIASALQSVSVTFASITYVTKVQTAAKHKDENIQKVTIANVLLCSNIKAHTSVYARKVKRTAATIAGNDASAVDSFTASENYFEHTDCYGIVQHKQHTHKKYLYAIYNNAQSVYMHNGNIVTKEHVAQYLTPSAAKDMLTPKATVHNKTHDIKHSVRVRTIALDNIVSMRVRRQLLSV